MGSIPHKPENAAACYFPLRYSEEILRKKKYIYINDFKINNANTGVSRSSTACIIL
jgi:hypothetical protein